MYLIGLRQFLLFISLVLSCFYFCQEKDSLKKKLIIVSAGAEYGSVLKTNFYLQDLKTKMNYTGYSVQLLKQTNGDNDWEKHYRYPQYGIGFFAFDFLQNKQMGSPYAIYGIYNAKLKQWGKLKWNQNINFGISFNSNPFDNDKQFYNITVGSKNNMFISIQNGIYYELGKYFDVGLNLKFNHLSNGAIKTPNKGLNTIATQVGLVYYPDRILPQKRDTILVNPKKFETLELSLYGGRKHVFYLGENRDDLKFYEGFKYDVYGIESFYMKQYSPKSAYGIGLGITYDEQYNNTMYVLDKKLYQKKRFSHDQFLFSVMPTYRLMIGSLYINSGVGYYLFKKEREYEFPSFFQKLELHYQITNKFFVKFGINAYNFHKANYLEWKLGYTLSKKQNH